MLLCCRVHAGGAGSLTAIVQCSMHLKPLTFPYQPFQHPLCLVHQWQSRAWLHSHLLQREMSSLPSCTCVRPQSPALGHDWPPILSASNAMWPWGEMHDGWEAHGRRQDSLSILHTVWKSWRDLSHCQLWRPLADDNLTTRAYLFSACAYRMQPIKRWESGVRGICGMLDASRNRRLAADIICTVDSQHTSVPLDLLLAFFPLSLLFCSFLLLFLHLFVIINLLSSSSCYCFIHSLSTFAREKLLWLKSYKKVTMKRHLSDSEPEMCDDYEECCSRLESALFSFSPSCECVFATSFSYLQPRHYAGLSQEAPWGKWP